MTNPGIEPPDETRFLDGKGHMWPGNLQPLGDDRYINIGGGTQLAVVNVDNRWRVQVIPPGHTGRGLLLESPVGVNTSEGRRAVGALLYEWAAPARIELLPGDPVEA